MLTDVSAPVALFLFAHQDDEFGVFARIEKELRAGRRVRCAYITDGAVTADPDLRDAESRAVLQKLGVSTHDIFFMGRQLGIGDGHLHSSVDVLSGWLNAFLDMQPLIVACFVPAWEGGHPDHDLLHAVAVRLFAARGCLEIVRQYSLYHGLGCIGPLFHVLSPLPQNGPVELQAISWRDRLRYLRFCLSYPSQWRSWVGLFPFVLLRYLSAGFQQLQHVSIPRLGERPHEGPLYYESRGFADWSTLREVLNQTQHPETQSSESPLISSFKCNTEDGVRCCDGKEL